jgi:hypothetical protein
VRYPIRPPEAAFREPREVTCLSLSLLDSVWLVNEKKNGRVKSGSRIASCLQRCSTRGLLALPLVGDNQTDEPQQQWPVAFREAISFTYLYIILLVPLAATAVLWTKLEPATAKTAC